MILGITGATGFVGHHVEKAAQARGDTVIRFSRHPKKGDLFFSTSTAPRLHGCEGIVHLAGESIFGLWTPSKRRKILESRRQGTRRLVEGIANARLRPRVLVCASGIGYYGDRGERELDESSSQGKGFLADVVHAWEQEALQAEHYGVRVVCLRFGLVLGNDGGFLKKAVPFFRRRLGTQLGSGTQWMSCIHVEDLTQMILWCLQEEKLSGIINAVMPTPITNKDFTQTLAQAVHRPAFLKAPAWLLRFLLGDFSRLLLDSQRVLPKRAMEAGFQWQYPTVEEALIASR
ncbi:MAG: TIGR01777 family oxidoreductase [Verrucomicrobiae bacterium]|nr:TIGR01777 family oxidoreductase [Verrucomicrobiae bacterium]